MEKSSVDGTFHQEDLNELPHSCELEVALECAGWYLHVIWLLLKGLDIHIQTVANTWAVHGPEPAGLTWTEPVWTVHLKDNACLGQYCDQSK